MNINTYMWCMFSVFVCEFVLFELYNQYLVLNNVEKLLVVFAFLHLFGIPNSLHFKFVRNSLPCFQNLQSTVNELTKE